MSADEETERRIIGRVILIYNQTSAPDVAAVSPFSPFLPSPRSRSCIFSHGIIIRGHFEYKWWKIGADVSCRTTFLFNYASIMVEAIGRGKVDFVANIQTSFARLNEEGRYV